MLTETIRALEERLLERSVRDSRSELETLLAENFREIGRSGRTFDRESIIAELADEEAFECTLEDFRVDSLGDNVVLATYTSRATRPDGVTIALRSSVWARRDGRWQLVFHQGTPKP